MQRRKKRYGKKGGRQKVPFFFGLFLFLFLCFVFFIPFFSFSATDARRSGMSGAAMKATVRLTICSTVPADVPAVTVRYRNPPRWCGRSGVYLGRDKGKKRAATLLGEQRSGGKALRTCPSAAPCSQGHRPRLPKKKKEEKKGRKEKRGEDSNGG